MKKSFKKAGAAVLSMAMLLAMGAVTMPVYAVNPPGNAGAATNDSVNPGTGTNATNGVGDSTLPGAVYISLPASLLYKQGEGTNTDWPNGGVDEDVNNGKYRYDYIPGGTKITDAQINIYKVAELTGDNGWKWNNLTDAQITAINSMLTTADATGATTEATTFEKLLKKISGSGQEEFATNSGELKNLASYLERNKTAFGSPVATGTLNNANQTIGFTLPEIDPGLMDGGWTNGNAPATMNKIGYYLITTTTDQSGILVQPVLISLKNGQENPKNISLKGSVINIEKRITHVGTEDTDATPDGINDNHDDKIYDKDGSSGVKGGKRATVGKNDIVHYEISAQLPQYDTGLDVATNGLENFVIHDYAGDGITIIPGTVSAYVSGDDESKTGASETTIDNWYLDGDNTSTPNSKDYTYQVADDGHSMDLTITLQQMRGENGSTSKNDNTKNTGSLTTMENKYIIVSFDAYVDGSKTTNQTHATTDADLAFDRSYVAPIDYTTTIGTIVYNTEYDDAADLADIYADWAAYVTANDYTNGVEEAVLAAKAAGTYDSYVDNADLKTTAGGVTGMYAGYTSAATLAKLKKADGTAYDATEIANMVSAEVPKEQVIALLLAIDHYNSTRNGETNYADMTYGNNYSTGTGKARDISNDTTVYSVDMRLNKFVEKLTLAHKETIALADITRAEFDTALAAITGTVADADVPNTAPTKAAIQTAFGITIADADENKYRKAAAAAIATKQTALDANKNYDQTWEKEAVKDAVFKMTDPDGNDSYVVSLGDDTNDDTKDGLLVYLTEHTYTDIATVPTDAKYVDETNKKYYTLAAGAEPAWAMLQTGEYTLTEVKAPTGFKKWANPVVITVSALDKDGVAVTATTKPDGAYQATGTSTTITEIASQLTEKGTDPVTFKYYTDGTNKASAGVLTHDIYNEYQDTLPATGGIGTVLFTAGGISVVLIAGALFVMYMKKKNSEDEE